MNVLCSVRLYSILGIMPDGKFYNNLEFNGAELEEQCATEFEDKCEREGIVFVSKEAVSVVKTPFDDVKFPELTPHVW